MYLFICLFLAVLGLRCCARTSSNCSERGLLFIVVHRLLIAVASLCCRARASVAVAHGLSCSACGMWDLPGPGFEPMSPALAGRFLTTVPPGKSLNYYSYPIFREGNFDDKSITYCFKYFIEGVLNKILEVIIIFSIINFQYLHLGATLPTKNLERANVHLH